jgi:hypothetical protein
MKPTLGELLDRAWDRIRAKAEADKLAAKELKCRT